MLYIFELDGQIRVSNIDPDDATIEFGSVLDNSFIVRVPMARTIESSANVVRNILQNGGAAVTLEI